MRLIVFFDLPSVTNADKRRYRKFRKYLIDNGYLMMQESVYCKLLTNYGACELEVKNLQKNKPSDGLVQCLQITEKQYASIKCITGECKLDKIDSMDRLTIL